MHVYTYIGKLLLENTEHELLHRLDRVGATAAVVFVLSLSSLSSSVILLHGVGTRVSLWAVKLGSE